jgi:hypothetical protein
VNSWLPNFRGSPRNQPGPHQCERLMVPRGGIELSSILLNKLHNFKMMPHSVPSRRFAAMQLFDGSPAFIGQPLVPPTVAPLPRVGPRLKPVALRRQGRRFEALERTKSQRVSGTIEIEVASSQKGPLNSFGTPSVAVRAQNEGRAPPPDPCFGAADGGFASE